MANIDNELDKFFEKLTEEIIKPNLLKIQEKNNKKKFMQGIINATKDLEYENLIDLDFDVTVEKYDKLIEFKGGIEKGLYKEIIDNQKDYYYRIFDNLPESTWKNFLMTKNQLQAKLGAGQLNYADIDEQFISNFTKENNMFVEYINGRRVNVASYLKMVNVTERYKIAEKRSFEIGEQLGTQVYQVSAHPNPREACASLENRYVSFDGTTSIKDSKGGVNKVIPIEQTTYGQPGGFRGINCKHLLFPIEDGFIKQKEDTILEDAQNNNLFDDEAFKEDEKLYSEEYMQHLKKEERIYSNKDFKIKEKDIDFMQFNSEEAKKTFLDVANDKNTTNDFRKEILRDKIFHAETDLRYGKDLQFELTNGINKGIGGDIRTSWYDPSQHKITVNTKDRRTIIHEYSHSQALYRRKKDYFYKKQNSNSDEIEKAGKNFKEIRKSLEKRNLDTKEITKKIKEINKQKQKEIIDLLEKNPTKDFLEYKKLLTKELEGDGSDFNYDWEKHDDKVASLYDKIFNKPEIKEKQDRIRDAYDIFDAIFDGELQKLIGFGHGQDYFKDNSYSKLNEIEAHLLTQKYMKDFDLSLIKKFLNEEEIKLLKEVTKKLFNI